MAVTSEEQLQEETVELLRALIRIDTVNPPGNERPAIEHLRRLCEDAGFDCEVLAAEPERPNLVATLAADAGVDSGPVLCLLGHVDTVLADPDAWTHDPWSAELVDGFVWGRGALDMKNQVAAETTAAISLARAGWRPARGALRLVFVSDEETGGEVGADWLCTEHPEAVRCDMLLNEGGGEVFSFHGTRRYGVCCAEKGIFRFTLTAEGEAGHASMPALGDNALLKLAPALTALADPPDGFEVTDAPAALLRGLELDPDDPAAALSAIADEDPMLHTLIAPMFEVTLAPTVISASRKLNVIPSRAEIRVDCRVPPGLGEDAARRRIEQVLGPDHGLSIDFFERIVGNGSQTESELMTVIERWIADHDPGATTVPLILPGYSDSNAFRAAFPDCVAYGFFPQRHMTLQQATPLWHNADERIDIRDLGFAATFYRDCITALLS